MELQRSAKILLGPAPGALQWLWGSVLGWDGQDQLSPEVQERGRRDAAPMGWPSRTTPINTERESREDNTGKQKRRTGQEEAGEGIG